jgi:hypothetical protein
MSAPAGPGPPAEVYIYVLPPVAGGGYSLMVYPRRAGDTCVYHTPQGQNPTAGRSREILWIPSGLRSGQMLQIAEKGSSPGKGHFQPIPPMNTATPYMQSGPVLKGPGQGRQVTWSYEIRLTDGTGQLACLDPDVIIITDP